MNTIRLRRSALGHSGKIAGTPFQFVIPTGIRAWIEDVVVDEAAGGYLSSVAPRLTAFSRDRGVLLRPLGNTVYVMPPYCIGADLDAVYAVVAEYLAGDGFPAACLRESR